MNEIDTSSFEKFANELASKYPEYALESAIPALEDMSDYLLEQVPEYPAETLGRLMPPDGVTWLRTPKQRAWFFAAVKANQLPGWQWVEGQVLANSYRTETYTLVNEWGNTVTRKRNVSITVPGHPQKIGGARTGNLGRAQGRNVSRDNDAVIAVLGFDPALAPYAPWVVGATYPGEEVSGTMMWQAQIHVDRWWQFGSIIESNLPRGWAQFEATFWEEFSKRIKESNNG